MDNKQKYIQFAQEEKDLPLFIQPWWLEAVAPGQWDVALVEKGGSILAAWPYFIQKKFGFRLSLMPPLTQRMGVYIKYPQGQKYFRRLSYEKELIFALYEQIPAFHAFSQNLDYRVTNVLPFHWLGFETRVRYTYVIENKDIEEVFGMSERKNEIKKAQKGNLKIVEGEDIEILHELVSSTYRRKGQKYQYPLEVYLRLDMELSKRERRKIFFAIDDKEGVGAVLYVVWDNRSMFNLLSAYNPDSSQKEASTLLVWNAIKMAMEMGLDFDFEGSMNPGIERFFRGFGARQRQITNIYKINSKLLCLARCLIPKVKRII